ncbi:MAG: hypothetical protein IH947_01070 [Bacteroidetes bacterium]|nr:hypothetical protein [Bacteroidota bacterium]MCH8231769.1 hypothetical protein [Bacteroidota bacterium]
MSFSKAFKRNTLLVAGVIVPDLRDNEALSEAFWENFVKLLSGLPPESVGKLQLLIKVVSLLSWIYNLKPFTALNARVRQMYIDRLFSLPVSKIAGGLTGLRSLIFISFYGIPTVWESINYEGPIVNRTGS